MSDWTKEEIVALRERRKETLVAFGRALDPDNPYGTATVWNWEAGTRVPRGRTCSALDKLKAKTDEEQAQNPGGANG